MRAVSAQGGVGEIQFRVFKAVPSLSAPPSAGLDPWMWEGEGAGSGLGAGLTSHLCRHWQIYWLFADQGCAQTKQAGDSHSLELTNWEEN